MSLKPTHPSGVKDQPVGDYTDAVTRGGSGVEEGTCQDEDEVIGVSQEDSGRDLGLVKGDDGNRGRGLDLMSEEPQQFEDASILKGESQSPIELEPTNMVYTPHLFAGLSPDGCPLQQLEQTTMDETVGNEHIEQAHKDEHTEQLMGGVVPRPGGTLRSSLGGVPMTFGESMPGGQPGTREKEVIWKGELEWQEKLKKGPAELNISHSVNCTVSTSKENGVPEVKPDNWPAKLIMQLIPKFLVQTIGGQYLRNSKSVLFHPNECESLDALTKVMGTGFAGCVHFTGVQACDIKVLILLYSNDKKAFLGFIPNDQVSFVDRIRTMIQQQKTGQQVRAQGQMPEHTNMVFAGLSPQTGNDETVGNEHIEQADKDEHIEQADKDEIVGNDLPPDRKGISAKHLPQELAVFDSQDWSVLLPDEVVLILFKFMKPGDILKASQTCQLWRNLCENDKLWEQKCKEAGLVYSLTAANLTGLERRNKNSIIAHSAWKENFLKPYKLARKLREGVLEVLTVERSYEHRETKMELFNDKIVSSRDNNLYVFCASSGKLLHELVGHTSDVVTILMDDLFIVSGSHDGSVKVWNVDTGSCLHTLVCSSVPVLQMHGTILVSSNMVYDWEALEGIGGLRVWDVREGTCLKILTERNWVSHVQFNGWLVVSGGHRYIKIWDPETGVCLRTFNHHSYMLRSLLLPAMKFNGVVVVAGYNDGSIKVWEVNTGICRLTLVENYFGDMIELQGDMMVCRGADRKTPKIWNMYTGACLNTLGASNKQSQSQSQFISTLEYKQHISDIEVNDRFVVTSSRDGTVKLWDIKTGEFIRNLFVLESDGCMEKMRMKDGKIVCFVFAHER